MVIKKQLHKQLLFVIYYKKIVLTFSLIFGMMLRHYARQACSMGVSVMTDII